METRAPEISDILCRQLSELIKTNDGGRVFRLMAHLANPNIIPNDADMSLGVSGAQLPWASNPGGVGIWEPKTENGQLCLVRGNKTEWTLWANVERIGQKTDKKRILYFGESAARGYFYDPFYTPAHALQTILQSELGADDFEVVDLARTDITLPPLLELIKSSLVLNPDAIVVFAGNNWNPYDKLSWAQTIQLTEMLRESKSWLPLKEYMEERQRSRGRIFIERLVSLSSDHRIPVIVVIPEFNLVDWRDCGRNLPWLGCEETARWIDAEKEAERSLAAGDYETAIEMAQRMVSIDKGTMPFSLGILAEGKRRKGEIGEARLLWEQARDTALIFPGTGAPRCHSVIQESLRSNAERYGVSIVDLPRRFQEFLSGELPDRRLFMDYCHLTSDGIQIAMASVAEHILRLFGKPGRSWSELKALAAAPTSKTMANASFFAANHNFNWGQGDEIVRYHCSNALRNDPEIARSMRYFIDFQTRGAPTLLCASFERFTQDNLIMIEYHLNPTHSEKQAKLPLINVMLDALNEMYPDLRDQTEELRKKEHAVTSRGVDLLKSYYSRSTYEDQRLASGQKLGYHRSLNIESRFFFICEAKSDIGFTITYRTPDEVTEGDKVLLLVNNTYVEEAPATRRWRNAEITVPAEHVREGVNSITVRWPPPVLSWVDRINRTAERLDYGVAVSLRTIYHIYGEISAFKAFKKTDKCSK